MPRIGLTLRGERKVTRVPAPPAITLYEDTLATWGYAGASFVDRQWFCSSGATSVFYGVNSGASGASMGAFDMNARGIGIEGGPNGKHCLVHFDPKKDMYPTYLNNRTYDSTAILTASGIDAGSFSDGTFPIIQGNGSGGVITVLNGVISVTSAGTGYGTGEAIKAGGSRYYLFTGETVYGGIHGHALFRKTRLDQLQAANPIFSQLLGNEDGNGWTRYRPVIRTVVEGKAVNVRFKLEVVNPSAAFYTGNNSLKIGLFGSGSGGLVNSDGHGTVNTNFSAYTGYMIGIGANHRIYKRNPLSSNGLISTMTAYTMLETAPMSFNPTQNPFLPPRNLWPILQVDLTIGKSEGNAYINSIVTGHAGNGDVTNSPQLIITDTAGSFEFDTLAVGCSGSVMDAFKISDVKVIYV